MNYFQILEHRRITRKSMIFLIIWMMLFSLFFGFEVKFTQGDEINISEPTKLFKDDKYQASGYDAMSVNNFFTMDNFNEIAQYESVVNLRMRNSKRLYDKVSIDSNYISLTFNDAPLGDVEAILQVLKENNMRCTFFVLGEDVEGNEDILKQIAKEGHTLGNCGFEYIDYSAVKIARFNEDLLNTQKIIKDATGFSTVLFRPPYGSADVDVKYSIKEYKYNTVMWAIDTDDEKYPDKVAQKADSCEAGDIILLHTTGIRLEELDKFCKVLKEQGLSSVPVEELVAFSIAERYGIDELSESEVWTN